MIFQYSILFPPEKLFDSGALDETFLLLMGDHGFRMDFSWGGTDQGKTEATMPALAVLAPQHFRTQHPDKAQEQNFIIQQLSHSLQGPFKPPFIYLISNR